MKELTTHERMELIFRHEEPDRIPFWDSPWNGTMSRWRREGLPAWANADNYFDCFGLDKIARFMPDNSPGFEEKELSRTEHERIYTTRWGATQKELIGEDTTPEFLKFTITDPDSWQKAKERMVPTKDRIDWAYLKQNYQKWVDEGYWKVANLWFGFDVTHSWMCGTENILIALLEEPEWCVDMFNTLLDLHIALYEMILNEGYRFDSVWWWDDMGYKNNQFFSLSTYRDVAISGTFSGVDPQGGALTFRVTKNPARGAVTQAEEGSARFTYSPYENKTGKDSFTYVAVDEAGNVSQPAKVSIRIEKPDTKVTYADMDGNPAHKAAISLAERGIFVGEQMGETWFFRPEASVTREEFLAMAMDTVEMDTLPQVQMTGFADDESFSTWARP